MVLTWNVKDEIKQLITERFDQILAEQDEGSDGVKTEDNDNASLEPGSPVLGTITLKAPTKRKQNLADDARFAAKLHEELNAGRPSRSATAGSGPKRKPAPKKKSIVKKKKQVESDMSGEEPEKKKRAVNRNNPFNVRALAFIHLTSVLT